DGVPGVGAATVAHDDVGVLGEEIDDLSLALVAPLEADDAGVSLKNRGVHNGRPFNAREGEAPAEPVFHSARRSSAGASPSHAGLRLPARQYERRRGRVKTTVSWRKRCPSAPACSPGPA